MQTVIVAFAVILSFAYLIRAFWVKHKKSTNNKKCGGCGS
jgi:hypothetical protein